MDTPIANPDTHVTTSTVAMPGAGQLLPSHIGESDVVTIRLHTVICRVIHDMNTQLTHVADLAQQRGVSVLDPSLAAPVFKPIIEFLDVFDEKVPTASSTNDPPSAAHVSSDKYKDSRPTARKNAANARGAGAHGIRPGEALGDCTLTWKLRTHDGCRHNGTAVTTEAQSHLEFAQYETLLNAACALATRSTLVRLEKIIPPLVPAYQKHALKQLLADAIQTAILQFMRAGDTASHSIAVTSVTSFMHVVNIRLVGNAQKHMNRLHSHYKKPKPMAAGTKIRNLDLFDMGTLDLDDALRQFEAYLKRHHPDDLKECVATKAAPIIRKEGALGTLMSTTAYAHLAPAVDKYAYAYVDKHENFEAVLFDLVDQVNIVFIWRSFGFLRVPLGENARDIATRITEEPDIAAKYVLTPVAFMFDQCTLMRELPLLTAT